MQRSASLSWPLLSIQHDIAGDARRGADLPMQSDRANDTQSRSSSI